ncbi:hypothetical protein HDU83_008181 [Entophlyctis luteolus]|nr:hypothetical protein HDU83_008181 [Entophlyctis luteolus]
MSTTVIASLDDVHAIALSRMDGNARSYYESGAVDEKTLARNRSDFDRYLLRPRVLRDVADIDLQTTILGERVAWPVAFAPSAMHGLVHQEAELGTATAAKKTGTLMTLSTYSNTSLEDVIGVKIKDASSSTTPPSPFWLQLYVHQDRKISESLIKRAREAGYKALVLTVDAPVLGRRLSDLKIKFSMPSHLKLGNFSEGQRVMTQSQRNAQRAAAVAEKTTNDGSSNYPNDGEKPDSGLTWTDLAWLRRTAAPMKVVLKGIMTREDARLACEHGVDAIWVSNHGGRQLDSCASTICVLKEVVDEVRAFDGANKPEVYMDSGVRRGTDVVKALALGARAVFIGRPVLWGLAYDGARGVEEVVRVLKEETANAMALCGIRSVGELGSGTEAVVSDDWAAGAVGSSRL